MKDNVITFKPKASAQESGIVLVCQICGTWDKFVVYQDGSCICKECDTDNGKPFHDED